MTRTEAAAKIESALEAADYATSVWAPEGSTGPVRVYVTIPAASWKKKARKIGHVEINKDGTVESHLDVQSGTIMGLLPDMQIDPVAEQPVVVREAHATTGDESLDQFEAEQIRELGRTGELPGA